MEVCSTVFIFMQLDRRNSFRPFTALGRVMVILGGLIVIEHVIMMFWCLFYFMEFFPIFLDFFLELITSK